MVTTPREESPGGPRPGALAATIDAVFGALFAQHPEAVYAFDLDGAVRRVNPRAAALVDAPASALVGQPYGALVLADDRARVEALFERARAGEAVAETCTLVRRDGAHVLVRWSMLPVRAEAGGPVVGVYGVARDATALDAATAALAERDALYRTLVEQTPESVTILDLDGRYLYANPATATLYRLASASAVLGHDWLEYTHPDDRAVVAAMLDAVRADVAHRDPAAGASESRAFVKRVIRGDGTIAVMEGAVRGGLAYGGRPALLATGRDVTAARRAQHLEAVGRLAAGVAHDFNNVLMAIGGNAEFALEDAREAGVPDGHPLFGDLADIRGATARAADLTRQLLAFGRGQVLHPERTAVNAAVRRTLRLLERTLGEDVRLEAALAPDAGDVVVDAAQLEQAVVNLVLNARDAIRAGGGPAAGLGRIAVHTARVPAARVPAASVPAASVPGSGGRVPDAPVPDAPTPAPAGGWYAEISVHDTGSGMDEPTQARVFDPFFTTKPVGQGTGLGLASVHGFVVQSGGVVTVDSTLGAGTTFRILLPEAPPADAPPGVPAAPASPTPVAPDHGRAADRRRTTAGAPNGPALAVRAEDHSAETRAAVILLAEDDPEVREVLRRALDGAGARVLAASDGERAWRLWQSAGGRVDAVVTDVVMPDLGGIGLATRLRAARPDVPLLLLSGYADSVVRTSPPPPAARPDANTAYLQKPVSAERVIDVLRAWLAR